jgi:PGF-pre-PGF domain-containing protein
MSRSFNININQAANVNWYINGTLVQSNGSVTNAMFTNTNASEGTRIVNATAANLNGTVSREWTWIVIVNEINDAPVVSPSSSGGGGGGGSRGGSGGGGGGGSSGENYSNILLIEKYDLQISKDALTSYRFTDQKNPIMFVNITGNTSLGIITTSVEVLKDTSDLVKTPPDGLVYKNANIWVGTSGFATPKNIKEAIVRFRVENSWLSDNNFIGSNVKLFRWNKIEWIELETAEITKDDTYTYFEGKTNMFSPFAISSLKEAQSQVLSATTAAATEQKTASSSETALKQSSTKVTEANYNWNLFVFGAIVLVGIIRVISHKKKVTLKKRMSQEKNPKAH